MSRIIFLAAIAALTSAAYGEDSKLAGTWYAEGVENGAVVQIVVKNNGDGTFEKTVRDSSDCAAPTQWVESGHWLFDGTTYTETTENVDKHAVNKTLSEYNDAFVVTWIDLDHTKQFDPKTRINWTFTRVSTNFVIPNSSHCSL